MVDHEMSKSGILRSMSINTVLYNVYEMYRVSIKSFPNYKHLLQENYVEYKHIQL